MACATVGTPDPRKLAARDLPVPSYQGSGEKGGFSPADLRSAYKLPSEGGEGQTVAITIAYDDPNAEADLATYREHYKLPACTKTNGCFKKVNQLGEEGNYPAPNSQWALETSLDLDMVSAICPKCHIILVEAKDNQGENLYVAVEEAAKLGATVISNSWAGDEYSEETADDHYFNQAGIPILFASGDWGYGVYYPVASPNVIGVGGTTLEKAANSRGWSESAWSGAGSGCSNYETKPAWQKDGGCPRRTVADVSAVSDPETPVSVYDSYEYKSGWLVVGGTSVATPLMAGVEALSTSAVRSAGPSAFPRIGQGGLLFDAIGGENGNCSSYLCNGVAGYDGPTGWGTPNGTLSLPVAVTEGVSVASTAKATLRGSVRPGGVETKYRFEYGETTSYGTSVPVPDKSAGSGSEYVEVSQAIEGLKGKTAYHYRIVATQSGNTYYGIDRTFVTSPPSVITGSATGIGIYHATVGATVNPEAAATTYYFEYGATTSYGSKAPLGLKELAVGTSGVEVSTPLVKLKGNKTYHYRIVASNVAGTSYGTDKTFTTLPAKWESRKLPEPEESSLTPKTGTVSVSCVSSSRCIAVGEYWRLGIYHAYVTLAEEWNGERWSVMPTPNPPGLEEGGKSNHWAEFKSVSCASANDCVAVGKYRSTSEAVEALSQRWNGTKWEEVTVTKPSGATEVVPRDVSCLSATSCEMVGFYVNGSGTAVTLAEHWDGSKWEIQSTPNPSGATESKLSGVSCTSSTECTTAGFYADSSKVIRPLAGRWNGSGWTEQTVPSPAESPSTYFSDVECSTASVCTAVGVSYQGSEPRTFAERWNGTKWTEQSTPALSEGGHLYGVSCTSASTCVASGYYLLSGDGQPLLERWNGLTWSLEETQPPAVPAGWEEAGYPLGISCVETFCAAAGGISSWPEGGFISSNAFVMQTAVPPSVATKPASGVSQTEATLNGFIKSSDAEETCSYSQAECYFEYGQTVSYGATAQAFDFIGSGEYSTFIPIKNLEPGKTYHFRVVSSSEAGTSYGEDETFKTKPDIAVALSGMAVTDPFDTTTNAVSNFSSNWSALGWANGAPAKGEDTAGGWKAAKYSTVAGAYFAPTISDVGDGVATVATMATDGCNALTPGYYFSLWLDMTSPAGARNGYELRFTCAPKSVNLLYEVTLSKWVGGTQTVLGSKSEYSFAKGSSLALVDGGSSVSAWTNTGSGFTQLLSASDSAFAGGNAGLEGSGSLVRLSKFKVGQLLMPVVGTNAAINALPVNDAFSGSESPLSYGGAFAALAWDNSPSGHNTGRVEGGWGPYDSYVSLNPPIPVVINGAYWQKASFADTGAGDAVAATLTARPANASRYFSLWLNMPNPGSARSGYELRFTETSTNVYTVTLAKWVSGTETVLASQSGYSFAVGSQLALLDKLGTVSAWTKTGAEYSQLLSAKDSTYTSGFTGISGAGNVVRLTNFQGGPLTPS